jgi:hypothetical protein
VQEAIRPAVRRSTCAAVVGGLVAAWLAAGSTGMMAHSLRHAASLGALIVVGIAAWPGRRDLKTLWLLGAAVASVALSLPAHPVPNVLAAAVFLAALARFHEGPDRKALELGAWAVAVLAFYRTAVLTIPIVWHASDLKGQ